MKQEEIKTLKLKTNVDRENFYFHYLLSIKGVLGDLTDKEIEVLAAIYYWRNKITPTVVDEHIIDKILFSAEVRKQIKEKAKLTSIQSLNNYIKKFVDKGILRYDNQKKQYFLVGSIYFPIVNLREVEWKFNFVLSPENNETQTP